MTSLQTDPTTMSDLPNDSPDVDDAYGDMAVEVMSTAFGLMPKREQKDILSHLYAMVDTVNPKLPAPVFFSLPTGGGKSIVRDTFAATCGGVVLNIAPLLSLSEDQNTKLLGKRCNDHIMSFHLDSVTTADDQDIIIQRIFNAPKSSSIILFSSPQALVVGSPAWMQLIDQLIAKQLLQMVVLDEIHLFVQFGLWFRSELGKLKSLLFSKLLLPSGSKVPLLCMTATATHDLLQSFHSITGIAFNNNDIFWPTPSGMKQRQQCLCYIPTTHSLRYTKTLLQDSMLSNVQEESVVKTIIYSNSRTKLDDVEKKLRSFADHEDLIGDFVKITGPMSKEVKFHRTNIFLNDTVLVKDKFSPVVCLATRALGSAGWDSSQMREVVSLDFPPDIISLDQEKGRPGPYVGAGPEDNKYYIFGSLESIIHMYTRILSPSSVKGVDNDDYRVFQRVLHRDIHVKNLMRDFQQVLKLLVTPTECQSVVLERTLSNPYSEIDDNVGPCSNACQFCIDSVGTSKFFKRLCRHGVTSIIIDLLVGDRQIVDPVINKEFLDAIVVYPDVNKLIFKSGAQTVVRADLSRMLLMLFANELLVPQLLRNKLDETDDDGNPKYNERLVARLALAEAQTFKIHDESCWLGIPLF